METVLLAKQAIYDKRIQVFAYELLYRFDCSSNKNHSALSGDNATVHVLKNLLTELDFEEVTDCLPAFINFTRNLLLDPVCLTLPAKKVVIEILENIVIDEKLIELIKGLSSRGYTFALDDFTYSESYKKLLDYIEYIKLDVLEHDKKTLEQQVQLLSPFKIKLIAEKIENQGQLDFCQSLGFDYFQGYFLSEPTLVKKKNI